MANSYRHTEKRNVPGRTLCGTRFREVPATEKSQPCPACLRIEKRLK